MRDPRGCMCGARDCPDCAGPVAICAMCEHEIDGCPFGWDVRACERDRTERAMMYDPEWDG